MNNLLIGLRVKCKENHTYLKVTKYMIGKIVSCTDNGTIFVKFKGQKRNIGFLTDELKRVDK
jgi:hypothetical protein